MDKDYLLLEISPDENGYFHYVYQLTDVYNGCIYIGVHSTTSLDDQYMGSGKIVLNLIGKYGKERFTKKILRFFDSRDAALEEESAIVNDEFVLRSDTYNLISGGKGARGTYSLSKVSEWGVIGGKKRAKDIHESLSSNPLLKSEWYAKIGVSLSRHFKKNGSHWKGRRHKEASKKKIGKANAIQQKGEKNSQYGKSWMVHHERMENRLATKEEVKSLLKEGWEPGRVMSYNVHNSKINR